MTNHRKNSRSRSRSRSFPQRNRSISGSRSRSRSKEFRRHRVESRSRDHRYENRESYRRDDSRDPRRERGWKDRDREFNERVGRTDSRERQGSHRDGVKDMFERDRRSPTGKEFHRNTSSRDLQDAQFIKPKATFSEIEQTKRERLAMVKSLTAENDPNDKSKEKVVDSENEGEVDNDEDEMAEILGFSGFSSTKGKLVEDNHIGAASGAVSKHKARKYRQYMNRKGGFNRPLDKV